MAIGNTATHRTQIYDNGKLLYDWPISSGRPGDDTPDGSYLTIEKENPVQMVGPGYAISVPRSVRFTFSGDYHDAYWSVGEQGFGNVSHGCVNLSPAAETYYNLAVPGDPITIVRSPQAGTWGNGWTGWFLSRPQYPRTCLTRPTSVVKSATGGRDAGLSGGDLTAWGPTAVALGLWLARGLST